MQIDINYAPNFRSRYGYGQPPASFIKKIFEIKKDDQVEFLRQAQSFRNLLSEIPVDADESAPEPRWNQPWFPPLDGISLYSLIGISKPRSVIEIGSGNSTKFARRAIQDTDLDTAIVSIDPQPRAEIDSLSDTVLRIGLEDVDQPMFADLQPGDIVLFDGSHRCLQNSDVTVFFIDILPALKHGVIVGIHDIFWPNDYPERWIQRYYSEQYVLGAYMLAMGSAFPLILSCAYSGLNLTVEARACLSNGVLDALKAVGKQGIGGGCLWFRKPEIAFGS